MSSDRTAVIFDMGGVLVDWNPRYLYRKLIPDPAERERFLAEVCTMAWHMRSDAGEDPAEMTRELQALHPKEDPALITAFYGRFREMFGGSVEPMARAIEKLDEAGVRIVGLSNAPAWIESFVFDLYPFMRRLKPILFSGAHKVVKPDPAIYRLLFERAAIRPEQAVFIDDNAANIAAGKALGLATIHFKDGEQAAAELRAFGFPV